MSKLEEIKGRLNNGEYNLSTLGGAVSGKDREVSYDIKLLILRIERAEKALEECKAYDEQANCNFCGGKIKEITTEALQQLRS